MAQLLSVCLQLRSWSQGPGIKTLIRLPAQRKACFFLSHSPCLCSPSCSLSLCQINKWNKLYFLEQFYFLHKIEQKLQRSHKHPVPLAGTTSPSRVLPVSQSNEPTWTHHGHPQFSLHQSSPLVLYLLWVLTCMITLSKIQGHTEQIPDPKILCAPPLPPSAP